MNLQLNYEHVEPYPLEVHTLKVEEVFMVTQRLITYKERGSFEVASVTHIRGVPPVELEYRLVTYTAP